MLIKQLLGATQMNAIYLKVLEVLKSYAYFYNSFFLSIFEFKSLVLL